MAGRSSAARLLPAACGAAIDIGIDAPQRRQIANGLANLLADTYTLYVKTHAFHWNVEGPMFATLHRMFMEQYTELWNALDLIAERIRDLGFPAPGTGREFAKRASIGETDGVPEAMEMVRLLMKGHEAVARTAVRCSRWRTAPAMSPQRICSRSGYRFTKRPRGCCAAC